MIGLITSMETMSHVDHHLNATEKAGIVDLLSRSEHPVLICQGPDYITPYVLNAMVENERSCILSSPLGFDVPAADVLRVAIRDVPRAGYRVMNVGTDIPQREVFSNVLYLTPEDAHFLAGAIKERDGASWSWIIETLTNHTQLWAVRCLSRETTSKVVAVAPMAGGSYAQTFKAYSGDSSGPVLRKQATGPGLDKLTEEVGWMTNLEGTAVSLFPNIRGTYKRHGFFGVDLAYHEMPTLRTLILERRLTSIQASDRVCAILSHVGGSLYNHPVGEVPADYLTRTHLNRVIDRMADTARALPQMKRTWYADTITVNGRILRNLAPLAEELATNPNRCVVHPEALARIHGDLHFDNILCDPESDEFLLIDPRGRMEYDSAYDLGKVLHSCNSLYDLLHTGRVEVEGRGLEYNYQFTDAGLVDTYTDIRDIVLNRLKDGEVTWSCETNWLLKAKFAEACHMASVLPFHIKHDGREKLLLSLYVRGLELFNEVAEEIFAMNGESK